jgi:lysophospholipase L1-like esterase
MKNRIRIMGAAVALCGSLVATMATTATAAPKKTMYYVALGDSYAEGYQPGYTDNSETLHGYVNQVDALLSKKQKLTLENFGCGGATSTSILNTVGCNALATNGVAYPTTTQAQAAINFITAHPGQIGLITISIGGNDFDVCVNASDPISCVGTSMPQMKTNIETLASELRTAAGSSVPMIATTYPDSVLGAWVHAPANQSLASESVFAFKAIINPYLSQAYAASNVVFVDVTTATGAYTALSKTTTLKPYGKIPKAVALVCTYTWFCAKGDIHPTPAGYKFIAGLVAKAYTQNFK